MKTLLILAALCVTLSLCHGYCTTALHKLKIVNGQLVIPDRCTDSSDGSEHAIGTWWNSANCLECSCSTEGMYCCSRYGGIHVIEGCKAVLDKEACEYKFYKLDDPSKPCF